MVLLLLALPPTSGMARGYGLEGRAEEVSSPELRLGWPVDEREDVSPVVFTALSKMLRLADRGMSFERRPRFAPGMSQ